MCYFVFIEINDGGWIEGFRERLVFVELLWFWFFV